MARRRDSPPGLSRFGISAFLFLTCLTAATILLHGYHYGFDDQSVYLPAIKKLLDPGLYPLDSAFFLMQTRLSIFQDAVAATARFTHLPLEWVFFLWHFASLFLFLTACWRIARNLFRTSAGICGGLLLVTVLFTLPVAGTFIQVGDPFLHSRTLATAAILFAFADVLERRLSAAIWAALALLIHPTLAIIGLWHVAVQAWPSRQPDLVPGSAGAAPAPASLALAPIPLAAHWLADPSSDAWREAISGERYLFPSRWTWYETLGAFGPLPILWWFSRLAGRSGLDELACVCRRVVFSGAIGLAAGYAVGLIPALLPLLPLEPLRTLHLIYILLILFTGGMCAELLPTTWKRLAAATLVPLAAVMFLAQRHELEHSPHIEWPGRIPRNDWREAFEWIRLNTPRDALFAMNPDYLLHLPGEDEHGFRGLAERGQLAEAAKDRAVSRNIPALAWEWRQEVRAQRGIDEFDRDQLADLRAYYGATWLLLWKPAGQKNAAAALDCPYQNATVSVCRAP